MSLLTSVTRELSDDISDGILDGISDELYDDVADGTSTVIIIEKLSGEQSPAFRPRHDRRPIFRPGVSRMPGWRRMNTATSRGTRY